MPGYELVMENCARIYRSSIRENKPKLGLQIRVLHQKIAVSFKSVSNRIEARKVRNYSSKVSNNWRKARKRLDDRKSTI